MCKEVACGGMRRGVISTHRNVGPALVIIQKGLLHRIGVLLRVQPEQRRVGACPQRRVDHGDQREQHASGQRGGGGSIKALAQAVALVVVGLRHQRRVAQVRAVEREDGRWEQAAVLGLRAHRWLKNCFQLCSWILLSMAWHGTAEDTGCHLRAQMCGHSRLLVLIAVFAPTQQAKALSSGASLPASSAPASVLYPCISNCRESKRAGWRVGCGTHQAGHGDTRDDNANDQCEGDHGHIEGAFVSSHRCEEVEKDARQSKSAEIGDTCHRQQCP